MDNQLVWRLSNASLSAQSAPSPSLITLTYLPNQAPSASLLTLTYLPNQPHLPHSSPSPIPKASKGFSKNYHFVVSLHNSLHIKSSLIVDLKNACFCNYQAISIL